MTQGSPLNRPPTTDVSVCIVNWNGSAVLRNCLASLEPHDGITLQTIVVDNASTDGSSEIPATEFPNVVLIRNTENVGFARANNQAADRATGRYLFFLNNDTVMLPGSLGKLVGYLDAHRQAVAVGPQLIGADGKPQRSARAFPTLGAALHAACLPIRWTGVFQRQYRRYRNAFDPARSAAVGQLAASALLVRAAAYRQAGGWDDAFPFGVEDVDLCLRLSKLGEIFYLADARVTHLGRVSSHLNRGPVYVNYQCGHARYFRKHHRSRLAPGVYKVAVILDVPVRWAMLSARAALNRITGRPERSARSAEKSRAVWYFFRHGLGRFLRS